MSRNRIGKNTTSKRKIRSYKVNNQIYYLYYSYITYIFNIYIYRYREAGKRVADVLLTFTQHLERASVDEAYLDITEIVNNRLISCCDISVNNLKNTFVVGSTLEDFVTNINCNMIMKENDLRLAIGGIIAEEIREKIFQVTGLVLTNCQLFSKWK